MAELVFKSKDEQNQAFVDLQANKNNYKSQEELTAAITDIENAKIEPGDAQDDNTNEPSSVAQNISDGYIPPKEEDVQGEAEKPTEEPSEKPKEANGRRWEITEDLIKKYDEEFYDQSTNRTRSYITHKTPEDFVKSYIKAQKKIHYDNDKRFPQLQSEYEQKYNKAKEEYESKLSELQKKIDESTKRQTFQDRDEPQDKRISQIENDNEEIESLINKIDSLDSDDLLVENIGEVKNLFKAFAKKVKNSDYTSQQKVDVNRAIEEKMAEFKREIEEKDNQRRKETEAEKKKREHEALLNSVWNGMDEFVKDPDIAPELKISKSYKDVELESMDFNDKISETYKSIYRGKIKSDLTDKENEAIKNMAVRAYLSGDDPYLVGEVNRYFAKPDDYDKWVVLDQIEAMKNGWTIGSDGNWVQRYDPQTGNPVNLGDYKTAYNHYLSITGKGREMQKQEKSSNANSMIKAMQKRATDSMTELSENDLGSAGESMTKEAAEQIINETDIVYLKKEAMKGNMIPYDRFAEAYKLRYNEEPPNILS